MPTDSSADMTTPEELDAQQKPMGNRRAYQVGYAVGAASREAEITALRAQIAELEAENKNLKRRAEDAELFLDNAVSKSSEPLRDLGNWLADFLDEDQWPKAERLLNAMAIAEGPRLPQVKPLTAEALADAFDAMWNAAIGVSHEHREGIALASMLAEGFAAMGRTLREGAAIVPPGDGWRSMDSAPRDGTWFWAETANKQGRWVHFADRFDRYPLDHKGGCWATEPVRWRPDFPAPPASEGGA